MNKTHEMLRRRSIVRNASAAVTHLQHLSYALDEPPAELLALLPILRDLMFKYTDVIPDPVPPPTQWGRFERDDRSCRGGD